MHKLYRSFLQATEAGYAAATSKVEFQSFQNGYGVFCFWLQHLPMVYVLVLRKNSLGSFEQDFSTSLTPDGAPLILPEDELRGFMERVSRLHNLENKAL